MLNLLAREFDIPMYYVDHTAKDFATLLEESNAADCALVVLDGFDSHVGKRGIDTVVSHVKTATKKLLCLGHEERKSTSNAFAAKWKQFRFSVSSSKMLRVLRDVAKERVPNDVLERIVAASPTDIRSCINSLEMYLLRPSDVSCRDEFVDVIDAIERVFSGYGSFDALYKTFEHEPFSMASGVYENYLRSVQDVRDLACISDNMSAADVISTEFDSVTRIAAFCACSSGYVHVCENKKEVRVEKYGTLFSKNALRLANKKRLVQYNTRRAAKGSSPLCAEDIGLRLSFKIRSR